MEMAAAAFALSEAAQKAQEFEDGLAKGEGLPEGMESRVQSAALWRDASAAHDRVAQYVTPKLKAQDITLTHDGRVTLERRVRKLDGSMAEDD